MPQGSPHYLPDPQDIDEQGGSDPTAIFDGSASSSNAAIINSITADVDIDVFYEGSDDGGSTWGGAEADSFTAPAHSQLNDLKVEQNKRRVRIENVDTSSGTVVVSGREAVSSN